MAFAAARIIIPVAVSVGCALAGIYQLIVKNRRNREEYSYANRPRHFPLREEPPRPGSRENNRNTAGQEAFICGHGSRDDLEFISILPCKCVFCRDCLYQIQDQDTCPVCRQRMDGYVRLGARI